MLFGVRQLAAASLRVELLRFRKGASKLAHSKKDVPRRLGKSLPDRKGFLILAVRICVHLCSSVVSFVLMEF
ncbi:MAG: hypothetical protein DMG08_11680 [Acidobacteria bacterium]|nr:MAG: hypothetical protein DMG08_11680 [Acidobacteriota bacterium]PYV07081.1 MAG: hypothetical protein DMG10_00135 [Acidobacteriota bacterium]PYV39293.1 MAG: hypothetical protein DMG09_09540 [Acidobacteriota bacterium]